MRIKDAAQSAVLVPQGNVEAKRVRASTSGAHSTAAAATCSSSASFASARPPLDAALPADGNSGTVGAHIEEPVIAADEMAKDDKPLLEAEGEGEAPAKPKTPPTPPIVFVYIVLVALANMLFGFENSNISKAKDDFSAAYGIDTKSVQYGFLTGGMPIGATAACLVAGILQDRLGRRITLCLTTIFYIGAALVSYNANGFGMLAAGRVLTGASIGVFSSTVPMFIAELAPPHLRGTLVTLNQVSICTGILLGYAACKILTPNWRLMFIVGTPVAGALLLAFIFITPFSPRWLMSKGREEEARKVLSRIRLGGEEAVEAEIAGIKAALATAAQGNPLAKMREPHVMWAVAIGVAAATMQQWCGVNAVNGYAQNIFIAAGFDESAAADEAIYIGIAKLVFVIVALLLMDVAGRKKLLLIGSVGMMCTLIALAVLLQSINDPKDVPRPVGYGASASLILYMAFFEISLGPVLWLLLSELYPLQVKGLAMSIGSFTTWLFTYAVVQIFPFINAGLGKGGTFAFFACVCGLSFAWIWVYLPETKGRSLEEIEDDLRKSCGMPTQAEMAAAGQDGAKAGGNSSSSSGHSEGKGLFVELSKWLEGKEKGQGEDGEGEEPRWT